MSDCNFTELYQKFYRLYGLAHRSLSKQQAQVGANELWNKVKKESKQKFQAKRDRYDFIYERINEYISGYSLDSVKIKAQNKIKFLSFFSKSNKQMATRWGIVGAGKISHDFATAVLGTLPKSEHQLVAVAAQDAQRAKDFAKLHNIPSAYGSYIELANDKNVEVVYIGTLNPSHLELGKIMLNAGKHVLCEKPLTMNTMQTKELIALAKSKKLFLMEAIWSRCFPAYDTLKKELANKSIGDVKQVIVGFGFGGLKEIDRLYQKKLGGGTILDLGVYVIQFASLVFNHDKPLAIKAVGHVNEEGVDLSMSASLSYSDGRTATICTHAAVELPNRAYVIGTKGTISLPNFWCPPTIETPTGVRTVELPKCNGKFNFHNSVGLAYEAAEVRECLKKGLLESPKVTHANSIYIAEIEDELRRQIGVVYEADK